jgi:hypothetical protein
MSTTPIYTTLHKHHIIPTHAGGSDDPSNLVELTIEEHANAHKRLFFIYGHWQDELAYKGLSGMIGHDECIRIAQYHGSRKGSLGMKKTIANMSKKERQEKFTNSHSGKSENIWTKEQYDEYWTPERRKERSEKVSGHKNPSKGTIWHRHKETGERKKFKKNEIIPAEWITSSEYKEYYRKMNSNKNHNAYGMHWYTDGNKNYLLFPEDIEIDELSLKRGRIVKKKIAV